jgi:hypothetical protein
MLYLKQSFYLIHKCILKVIFCQTLQKFFNIYCLNIKNLSRKVLITLLTESILMVGLIYRRSFKIHICHLINKT